MGKKKRKMRGINLMEQHFILCVEIRTMESQSQLETLERLDSEFFTNQETVARVFKQIVQSDTGSEWQSQGCKVGCPVSNPCSFHSLSWLPNRCRRRSHSWGYLEEHLSSGCHTQGRARPLGGGKRGWKCNMPRWNCRFYMENMNQLRFKILKVG